MPLPLLLIPAASLATSAISSTTASTALMVAAAGAASSTASSTAMFFGFGGILGAGVGTAATAGYFTFFSRGSRATDAHSRKDSLISSAIREQIAAADASVASFKREIKILMDEVKAGVESSRTVGESLKVTATTVLQSSTELKSSVELAVTASEHLAISLPLLKSESEKTNKDLEAAISTITELKTLLGEKQESITQTRTENGELRDKLDAMTSTITQLKDDLQIVISENEMQKADSTKKDEIINKLRTKLKSALEVIAEYEEVLSNSLAKDGVSISSAATPA